VRREVIAVKSVYIGPFNIDPQQERVDRVIYKNEIELNGLNILSIVGL
jgi:hypothetical protein